MHGHFCNSSYKLSALSRRWNCKLGLAHNPQNRGIQLQFHDCRDLHSRLRKAHLLFLRILTQAPISASSKPSISATGGLAMASGGNFDLEKQFAQDGVYHSNKINILIHVVFVWPILFTAFMLAAYTRL